METIFSYLDYRKYLRDWYEERKARNSFISYRFMGGEVGLDASFLVKVLQGQLHVSQKSVGRLCAFLRLDDKEKEYFELLVSYNRAIKASDSKVYYNSLISLRTPYIKKIDADKYEFFSQWYYIAVYELLRCHPFTGDFRDLGKRLLPAISASEAKTAVSLLERLGFVVKNDSGGYTIKDASVSTGDTWMSMAISEYQKKLIAMGMDSIDALSMDDRDISTVSLSLSKATFKSVHERLKVVRKELLEIARLELNPEIVYQINFQVFPLSCDPATYPDKAHQQNKVSP